MRTGYEPTDDEINIIDMAGMEAAIKELEPLDNADLSTSEGVMACLRAFKEANKAVSYAKRQLLLMKEGCDYVEHYTEVTDIVCSAMIAHQFNISPNDCHPRSIAGRKLAVFIKSAKALESMQQVYCAFDDDDTIFGTYLAEETASFAENLRNSMV